MMAKKEKKVSHSSCVEAYSSLSYRMPSMCLCRGRLVPSVPPHQNSPFTTNLVENLNTAQPLLPNQLSYPLPRTFQGRKIKFFPDCPTTPQRYRPPVGGHLQFSPSDQFSFWISLCFLKEGKIRLVSIILIT